MKQVFIGIGLTILILFGFTALGFYTGFIGNIYDATVGKQQMNIQRNNFEQSQSYVDGMIQQLSKEKQEYDQSSDTGAKQAILNYVNSTFASFDANKITDQGLYNFLMKARGE